MARSKRTIRASELSSFLYCQRAWWYRRENMPTINTAELAGGQDFHRQHVHQTRGARTLQVVAIGLFICAVVLLILALVQLANLTMPFEITDHLCCLCHSSTRNAVVFRRAFSRPAHRDLIRAVSFTPTTGAGRKPANRSMMRTLD